MSNDYRTLTPPVPRGIRNNNPGDIAADGTLWQGATGNDGKFLIFENMAWGIRALETDLANKIHEGLNTIRLIVTKYAPASDANDVPAYIDSVSGDTGYDPDQVLTPDLATLNNLGRAVINHEIGEAASFDYITPDDITEGQGLLSSQVTAFLQAVPVAVKSAVQAPDGSVKWGNLAIGAAIAAGVFFLFGYTKKS